MSEISELKEVDFYKYCKLCKHKDLDEDDMPCRECLCEAVNIQSRKPVRFEDAGKSKKSRE